MVPKKMYQKINNYFKSELDKDKEIKMKSFKIGNIWSRGTLTFDKTLKIKSKTNSLKS